MKQLGIIISVLLTLSFSAEARHAFARDAAAAPTSVYQVGDPEFIEDITIGDDEVDQDGKKKKAAKNRKSSSAATSRTTALKRGVSPTNKLAALTPEEEHMIRDLPRKTRKAIAIELSTPLHFKYAILLDMPVEMINDNKLLETIESWYGVRYQYGGNTRKGVDCSAFTQAFILSYYNKELPRRSEDQYRECKPVKKKKLRQGDLVFFKTRGLRGGISHVGVYLCNNKFVHASTSNGVMISDLDEDYFARRYAGGGRLK